MCYVPVLGLALPRHAKSIGPRMQLRVWYERQPHRSAQAQTQLGGFPGRVVGSTRASAASNARMEL